MTTIQKIDDIEIITSIAARKKYRSHWIGFVVTEQNLADPENELGYVVYIANSENEAYQMPRFADDGKYIAKMPGQAVGIARIEVGGLQFE